jgi:hypothetical protein
MMRGPVSGPNDLEFTPCQGRRTPGNPPVGCTRTLLAASLEDASRSAPSRSRVAGAHNAGELELRHNALTTVATLLMRYCRIPGIWLMIS